MIDTIQNLLPNLISWLISHGLKILVIIFGAYLLKKFSRVFIERIIRKAVVSDHFLTKEAEKKREDTLIRIFGSTFNVLVWIIALMMILPEFGINIGPILAAAGIAGLAFGFGGQYLIL